MCRIRAHNHPRPRFVYCVSHQSNPTRHYANRSGFLCCCWLRCRFMPLLIVVSHTGEFIPFHELVWERERERHVGTLAHQRMCVCSITWRIASIENSNESASTSRVQTPLFLFLSLCMLDTRSRLVGDESFIFGVFPIIFLNGHLIEINHTHVLRLPHSYLAQFQLIRKYARSRMTVSRN